MRYSVMLQERRGAATIEDAERIVGGEAMLKMMRSAGWLEPVVCGNRLTLFDYDACLSAWKRVCEEGVSALRSASGQKLAQSRNP